MVNELEIRTLAARFFDGETTLEEERRLYELFRSAETLPADLEPLREMMQDLQSLPHDAISTPLPSGKAKGRFTLLAIAASLLLLLGMAGMWYHSSQQNECVAYVYGERVTDRELVMHEMQSAMASLNDEEATDAMESQLKDLFAE